MSSKSEVYTVSPRCAADAITSMVCSRPSRSSPSTSPAMRASASSTGSTSTPSSHRAVVPLAVAPPFGDHDRRDRERDARALPRFPKNQGAALFPFERDEDARVERYGCRSSCTAANSCSVIEAGLQAEARGCVGFGLLDTFRVSRKVSRARALRPRTLLIGSKRRLVSKSLLGLIFRRRSTWT